jgi:hypothetical protein
MTGTSGIIRKAVVGVTLAAAATIGFAACSSSSKSPPAGQNVQSPATSTAPASTPTTAAPSSGGASF